MSTPCSRPVAVDPGASHLVDEAGKPWFYLADTAWELAHRLSKDEADFYLKTRARQRFNAIQTVILAEFDGLNTPNRQGDRPLLDNDPARPNEPYFEHLDWLVKRMNELGLVAVLLPTWGDKLPESPWGVGPQVFTPANALAFGRFLGNRYRDAAVVWMVGGDRPVKTDLQLKIWQKLVSGLQETSDHLVTFHPDGGQSSSQYVHNEPWLAFNTIQSGHRGWTYPIETKLSHDLSLSPRKPVINAEPCYEDHPVMAEGWWHFGGWFDESDVRNAAYRSVFSGAAGHTYGCHDIWQFYDPAIHAPVNSARTPWQNAVDLPGANQMQHLRALIESDTGWQPIAHTISLACPATLRAASGRQVTYIAAEMINSYLDPLLQKLGVMDDKKSARWFNPRTGEYQPALGSRLDRPDPTLDWILEIV